MVCVRIIEQNLGRLHQYPHNPELFDLTRVFRQVEEMKLRSFILFLVLKLESQFRQKNPLSKLTPG